MLKKILAAVLAATILLSLGGCSSEKSNKSKEVSAETTTVNAELEKENADLKKENTELKDIKKSLEIQVGDLEKQITELSQTKSYIENTSLKLQQELTEDLNGNGDLETLKLECNDGGNTFKLSINGLSIVSYGSNIRKVMQIVDLNKNDKFKEIAIPEIGPSDDLYTHFYRFTWNHIEYMGTLGGNPEGDQNFGGIIINGDGTLTATRRGSLLHTWFYKTNYKFTDDYALVEVKPKNGLYSMGDYRVKVKKSIPIYRANKKDKLRDLKIGEEVILKYSDDKEVVVLETNTKELGYIMLENFCTLRNTDINTSDVFEGLCMAD